jgi:endonuclease/exonuclease/phosphatase family metal-dependent hydrolase
MNYPNIMSDICFINRRVNPSVNTGPVQPVNLSVKPSIFAFLALFLALFISCRSADGVEHGDSLKVMTFNIRFDNPADSINSWDNRKSLVVETLKTESPDIIGMQEVLLSQLTYLAGHLKGYGHVGVGREDGKTSGEYVPVFYRSDRYKVVEWGTFWLSSTPEDTGSVGWDAALPRICTWIHFTDLKTSENFFFLNTHFDHMGQTARKESANLILDFIAENTKGLPVIMTGDFNCTPDQEPYSILTNSDNGLLDACFLSASEICQAGTFNGFGSADETERIDLILLKSDWEVNSFQMLKINKGKMFISDHYPVVCILR